MEIEISIESGSRLVKVPVFVDGRGPFSFTFDTGASTTTLSKGLANSLEILSYKSDRADARGLGGGITTEFAKASIEIGSMKFDEDEVYVLDLDRMSCGAGINDGVLGHSTLKHCRIALDYSRRTLQISMNESDSSAARDDNKWHEFEYIKGSHLVGVPVYINDQGPYHFVLDTGAGNTVITPTLADLIGVRAEPVPGIARGLGGDVELKIASLASISVNSVKLESPQAAVVNLRKVSPKGNLIEYGILGFDFLRNLETHIDYPRKLYAFVE